MEQVGQHGGRRAGADQPLGLEGLDRSGAELFGLGVEQPARSAADAVGLQRLLQRRRLQQDRQAGDGALLHRRRRQRGQRRPDVLLGGRVDGDAFLGEDGRHPLRRPGALGLIVDARQRLQRHRMLRAGGQAAAEIVPVAAHGDRRGADRAAEVEGENLVVPVTAELHRHQRQQHRLARAGRADDQRVADVADMEAEPERRRAFGLAVEQRRRLEMLIPCRARPRPPRAGSCAPGSTSRPAAGGRWRRRGRGWTRARPRARSPLPACR